MTKRLSRAIRGIKPVASWGARVPFVGWAITYHHEDRMVVGAACVPHEPSCAVNHGQERFWLLWRSGPKKWLATIDYEADTLERFLRYPGAMEALNAGPHALLADVVAVLRLSEKGWERYQTIANILDAERPLREACDDKGDKCWRPSISLFGPSPLRRPLSPALETFRLDDDDDDDDGGTTQ